MTKLIREQILRIQEEVDETLEAQELAQLIHDVVSPLYPASWAALMEHTKV